MNTCRGFSLGSVIICFAQKYPFHLEIAKNNATVYIEGGFFAVDGPYLGEYFVLNLADNTNSQIIVTGGTFVNFDPSNANTEPGGNNSFVADGYTVVAEEQANGDIWYTVVAE